MEPPTAARPLQSQTQRGNSPASTPRGLEISSQVCDRCRIKKIRCDGLLPSCSGCNAAHVACTVSKKLQRRTKPRKHVEQQDKIIEQLRIQNEKLQQQLAQAMATPRSNPGNVGDPALRVNRPSPHFSQAQLLPFTGSPSTPNGPNEGEQPVIKHLGRLISCSSGTQRFAGSTTGIHFIRSAEKVYKTCFNAAEDFPESVYRLHSLGPRIKGHLSWLDASHLDLTHRPHFALSEPRSSYLPKVTKFFHRWSSVWPVLMQTQFFEAFHRIFNFIEAKDAIFSEMDLANLRQLYLVLAIDAWDSGSSGEHPSTSSLYFGIACQLSLLGSKGDLIELQSIVLTCLYLQLTRQHSLWIQTTGQAVRLAQSLGLHRHARRFTLCRGEEELRKRVWWCVYAVDIMSSIVHGMPKMIQDDDVDNDLPVDADLEDCTVTEIPLPLPGETTNFGIFITYVKLLRIMSACLKTLYTTTKRRNGVAKITVLDQELSVWRNSTGYLRGRGAASEHEGLTEESYVDPSHQAFEIPFINLLSNTCMFLIHQPALTFEPTHPQFMKSLSSCVRAGLNILITLSRNQDNRQVSSLLPNRASLIFQSTLVCFYHQWVCHSSSLPSMLDVNISLEKVAGAAVELLNTQKEEVQQHATPDDIDYITLLNTIEFLQSLCDRTKLLNQIPTMTTTLQSQTQSFLQDQSSSFAENGAEEITNLGDLAELNQLDFMWDDGLFNFEME